MEYEQTNMRSVTSMRAFILRRVDLMATARA